MSTGSDSTPKEMKSKTGATSKTIVSSTGIETANVVEDDEVSYDPGPTKMGCGIFGKYPIASLLVFVIIGLAIGVGMSYWRPETDEEKESKNIAVQWLGLIGVLYLRALKCIVLPIVFVNVVLAVLDMMSVGAAGGVGGKTVLLYLCTTVVAGIIGTCVTLIFKPWFGEGEIETSGEIGIQLGCYNSNETAGESYLVVDETTGTVFCDAASNYVEGEDMSKTFWIFNDVGGNFNVRNGGVEDVSLSDTVYNGVFMKLIPDNIFQEFVDTNFAAIVVFAIAMGVATSKVVSRMTTKSQLNDKNPDLTFVNLLVELDRILGVMIIWVIMCTPFAVCSMIIKAIANEDNLLYLFRIVGLLIGCTWVAFFVQYFLVYCGLYTLLVRKNPFTYTKSLFPAQIVAFASASSAATIPVSISSALSSGEVTETIARFIIPLGATVNMDGGAIYFPCACIWLAVFNGVEVNFAHYVLLVILATFGSMGTAPVPNAGLALIITAYNTVFNATGEPNGFGYIFAVDWFMDRGVTMVNVTGDTFVTAIISNICPLDGDEEDDEDVVESQKFESVEHQVEAQKSPATSEESGSFEYALDHFGTSLETPYLANMVPEPRRRSGCNSHHLARC